MPSILDALDAEVIELPATATYKRRQVEFTAGGRPGEFSLVIRLWKGLRAGSKCERDVYQVEEQPCVGRMGRRFLVLNVFDDRQPDVYEAVVGPLPACTCKAGLCNAPDCKHRDALAAVIAAGLI